MEIKQAIKIDREMVTVNAGAGHGCGCRRLPCQSRRVRLMVKGGNVAGYYVGIVPAGHSARKVDQGPLVPGPWAYAFALSAIISDCGGTRGDLDRDRAAGLIVDAEYGDRLEIDGVTYEIQRANNQQINLVNV